MIDYSVNRKAHKLAFYFYSPKIISLIFLMTASNSHLVQWQPIKTLKRIIIFISHKHFIKWIVFLFVCFLIGDGLNFAPGSPVGKTRTLLD